MIGVAIINKALLEEFRCKTVCEWCKKTTRSGLDPHHLWCRGRGDAFRLDVRINLAALCRACHNAVHAGNILRCDLLAVVAAREGRLQDEMEAEIRRLRWK